MSNILYISCHSVLEYDELKLLTSLGHSIFSIGSYFNPLNPAENIRPPLKLHQNPKWKELYYKSECKDNPARLSREFLSCFDIIIAMHGHKFFEDNLKHIDKKTRLYWRGIGQSSPEIEYRLKLLRARGVKLIRYSQLEAEIQGYAGEDLMIPFYKDERDFIQTKPEDRNGKGFLCYNSILQRAKFNDWGLAKDFVISNGFEIYGRGNEAIKGSGGFLSYEEQLQKYRTYFKIFCLRSYPAPYTLGYIEALMSGCEVYVCGSEKIMQITDRQHQKLLFSKSIASIVWNRI